MTKSNPNQGVCKLCQSEGELQQSHFLPKSAYKLILRSEDEPPVVVKPTVTVQTNEQMKDYVLCRKCEQRFNENREGWVMNHCARNTEGFKLKDLVEASKPLMGNGLKFYFAAAIPQIDVEQLTYFVASIVWRASIHDWKSGKDRVPRLYLGDRYVEELRRYLLGEAAFPRHAVVWVSVIPEPKLWSTTVPPYGEKMGQCWRYKFPFLGISFMLFLGQLIDPTIRRMCTLRSDERFIFIGDAATEMVIRDFGRLIAKSRPVGSLSTINPSSTA